VLVSDLRRPLIDAELRDWVWRDVPEGQVPPSLEVLDPAQLPMLRDAVKATWLTDDELRHDGRVEFDERTIPGFDGDPNIPVLILRPAGINGPRPAIVNTHSLGRINGGTRSIGPTNSLDMVTDHQLVMAVVGIRFSPEHPHPAHVRDGYAALRWMVERHAELGIDPGHVGLMGMSGGGGVAAGTALFARDRGGPGVSHLMLLSPMLDDRNVTVSNGFDLVVHAHDSNEAAWKLILGEAKGGPLVDEYAAPSRATNLAGLPPMYVETGSADTFRDESLDFAMRAGLAGVPVELHSWAGAMHCVETYAADIAVSRAALAARRSFLERTFGPASRPLVPNAATV
jgi:acetyl esterase/lipase